jgi:hypothetical protein
VRKLAAALIVIAIVLIGAAPAAAGPGDALDRALAGGRLTPAQYALERARSLFALEAVRAKYGDVAKPGPHAATLILRDLVVALPRLSDEARRSAEALLARPTDGSSDPDGYTVARKYFRHLCTTRFCIHWVTRSSDAPSLTDRKPRNRVPDWIDKTKAVVNNVWDREIRDLGYRAPQRDPYDGHHGGNPNGKLDIFIADVGRNGLYGYCGIDDPDAGNPIVYRVAAFCVFDDNYSSRQFGTGGATGVAALKVTAAHEIHHAEQFNYDFREDRWFMEATATNIEAAVYPSIHDNYQYLATSPLSPVDPSHPIDEFSPISSYPYGSWIFFRFLSEYFSSVRPAHTVDHSVPHAIWDEAAASAGSGGLYSTEAIEAVLAAHGPPATFFDVFRDFGVVNVRPAAWYKNGGGYPSAGASSYPLALGTRTIRAAVQHMATRYLALLPPQGATTLTVSVNLPDDKPSLAVTLLSFRRDGAVTEDPIALNAANDGAAKAVEFSPASIRKVLVVLTNGGTDFDCGADMFYPVYSCLGTPLDDVRRGRYLTLDVT